MAVRLMACPVNAEPMSTGIIADTTIATTLTNAALLLVLRFMVRCLCKLESGGCPTPISDAVSD